MRVKLSIPIANVDEVREKVLQSAEKVEEDITGAKEWEIVSSPSSGRHRLTQFRHS